MTCVCVLFIYFFLFKGQLYTFMWSGSFMRVKNLSVCTSAFVLPSGQQSNAHFHQRIMSSQHRISYLMCLKLENIWSGGNVCTGHRSVWVSYSVIILNKNTMASFSIDTKCRNKPKNNITFIWNESKNVIFSLVKYVNIFIISGIKK